MVLQITFMLRQFSPDLIFTVREPFYVLLAGLQQKVHLWHDSGMEIFSANSIDIDSASFAEIRVKSLPADGTLKLDGVDVTDEQVISVADITAGKLTFDPDANWEGPSTQFDYQVVTVHSGVTRLR